MVGEEKEETYRGFLYLIAILTFISIFIIKIRVDYLEMEKEEKAIKALQQEIQRNMERQDQQMQQYLDSLKLDVLEKTLEGYEDNR